MQRPLVEEGLTRVIGVDGVPDRRLDGLDDDALLAIHRSLVLLRTYDERSVVYHRQGRIGTYAIFWGHEAIQAGAVHALERRDWIFPSYRESAIGLLRGLPAATILQWWRGHPSGWWNPAELQRRVDLRADRDPRAARGRAGVGPAAAAARRGCALALLRRRRDLRGRVPRGRELRRGHEARRSSCSATTTSGRSRRRSRRRRAAATARRQGGRLRDAGRARSTAATCSPSTRRRARRSRARARATARRSSRRSRIARRRTRRPTTRASTSTLTASRPRRSATASAALRGLPAAARVARRRCRRDGPERGARRDARGDRGSRERGAGRPRARLRARLRRAAAGPRARPRRASADPRMTATAVATRELLLVEAVNDALHVELARDDSVMVLGEDVGRARRGLPGDGRPARPVRPRPLRRHAALRGRDPRCGGRPLHGRLAARRRDAVRRLLLPVPRPADHARRPLPLADGGQDGLPARRPHAVRRRRPRARAARRLARDVLRPHARREGRSARRRPPTRRACSPRRSAIRTRWSCSSRSSSTAPPAAPSRRASTSSSSAAPASRARGAT